MAPCWGCASAEKNLRTACFSAGCRQCDIRSLAQSPCFFSSVAYSDPNDWSPVYRRALAYTFGKDWLDGHQLVAAWAKKAADASRE